MRSRFDSVQALTKDLLAKHPDIISNLSKLLGLRYEGRSLDGNVCLLESNEVRPEFREVFTLSDIVFYVFAESQSSNEMMTNFEIGFPFPQNATTFWQLSETGRILAQDQMQF